MAMQAPPKEAHLTKLWTQTKMTSGRLRTRCLHPRSHSFSTVYMKMGAVLCQ
eukprot:COSAG01_NODE_5157_length_4446_cov_1.899471_6_plen_52_part_00